MTTRRGLLTGIAAVAGGGIAWDASRGDYPPDPGASFCPSDEWLENNSFVTGRLYLTDDGPFEPGEAISLVASIRNSGGAGDTFDRTLRADHYDRDREMVTEWIALTSVERELPPESETKIRLNTAVPEKPGEWWLTMGQIAFSCDLIGELRVEIEVAE